MDEEITFTFTGALADRHALDFYEAGRFQYGAARLMVKLDQFRRNGRFSSRVTYENNTRILLRTQTDGSFEIATLAPMFMAAKDAFLEANISLMWSYVMDRILKPATTDNVREALQTQREMIESFEKSVAGRDEQHRRTTDMLAERIDRGDHLTDENRQLYERLLAEGQRRAYLEGHSDLLRRSPPTRTHS